MKKITALFFIIATTNLFAQTTTPTAEYKTFYLQLSGGASIPQQGLGRSVITNKPYSSDTTTINGFANTGFSLNFSIGLKATQKFGFLLQTSQSFYSFSNAGYANAINTAYPNSANYSAQNISALGKHHVAQYLVGINFSLPLQQNNFFEISALTGITTSSYPTILQNISDAQGSFSSTTSYATGMGIAYNLSAGARHMFNSLVGLQLTMGYAGARITYPGYSYNNTYTSTTSMQTYKYSYSSTNNARYMTVGMVNITIGLVLAF